MNIKLGVIGASEDELNPFIENMQNNKVDSYSMLDFNIVKCNNIDIVSVYSCVCKVNAAIATQILIDRFNVTQIIIIGVAGAIKKSLKIRDTVISTQVVYHDIAD